MSQPFAGDDNPTPLESDYRKDHPEQFAHLQSSGLIPKGFDVDPPAVKQGPNLCPECGRPMAKCASCTEADSEATDIYQEGKG